MTMDQLLLADSLEHAIKIYGQKQGISVRFPKQDALVNDRNRFICVQCSRRAGKSNGLARRYFRAMAKYPGSLCIYIALTRESARNILWPILQDHDAKLMVGCEFTESNLTMTHPNGARLQLFGADMKNFIRRLKGIKTPAAGIDEAQDFGSHLQNLVDDVLTPTLTDYSDSWLAIAGTPGPIPMGYFYEITQQKKYGFSHHEWTLFDNPYLPSARKFVEELKTKRGWDDNHPTLQREWYNRWIRDDSALAIHYNEGKNHYEKLPHGSWNYIMGIDIGFQDADAIAVVAWSEKYPETYLVDELVTNKQGLTELVKQIEFFRKKYPISKLVMDEGGLGKKLAEEVRRRHHIPVQPAEKSRKFEIIEFLNDALRTERFKAKRTSRFVLDSYQLQVDWDASRPDKLKIKDGFHSDIIDAVLYAFRESPAFTYQKPVEKPKYQSKEWFEEEVSDMEQAAEEFFQQQQEVQKW